MLERGEVVDPLLRCLISCIAISAVVFPRSCYCLSLPVSSVLEYNIIPLEIC